MIDEERPVADRLEGISLPSENQHLYGHDAALQDLAQQYHAGQLHHAWLLNGPRGVGKATFAFHMARHILAHPNPSDAPARVSADDWADSLVRQVANGGHPDLLHLTRPWDDKTKKFKTQLAIDEVRRTQGFYGMTAGGGGWRITIVDAADDMNASAANALLKILEEPPKRSLFFVITHSAGSLLPTIRSRCQRLSLSPLKAQDMGNALQHLDIEAMPGSMERTASLAEGSVRRAIVLASSNVMAEYDRFEKLMQENANGAPAHWLVAHSVAEAVSKRGEDDAYHLFIDLVTGWVSRQVRTGQGTSATLAGWAEVWEKALYSTKTADAFNLDKKQVILSLFGSLFERNRGS